MSSFTHAIERRDAAAIRVSGGAMASPVLLVVALAAERRALQGSLQARRAGRLGGRAMVQGRLAGRDMLLVQSGIGPDRAREAVAAAAREFDVQAAWSLGFAGALSERLRPGDLVFPAAVLDAADPAGTPIAAGPSHAPVLAALRCLQLPADSGALLTVESALGTPEAKRDAGRRSGAVAVEMEAAGVVRAALELGLPWAALKAIVDGVDDPLPPFLARCTTPRGDMRWRGLLAGALAGSECWLSMRRLGLASRQAGRNLRRGLEAAFGAWAALTPM
jgi:adenosylhomocysteine nucleosidase